MDRTGDTLPRRLTFLTISLLIAANLGVLSLRVAAGKGLPNVQTAVSTVRKQYAATQKSIARTAHKGIMSAQHGYGTARDDVAAAAVSAVRFGIALNDINTYIRPADAKPQPVIAVHPVPVAPIDLAAAGSAPIASTLPVATTAVISRAEPVTDLPVTTVGNLYAWGNCTWWVASRRAQTNDPIPNSWGNAATWAIRAADDGYAVDHQPAAGAIMQRGGGLGHVAFVEAVDPDGTWHISEMNVLGLDVIDRQTEPASAAADYNFIHDPS